MIELVLPKGAYRRANGNLPPFDLINMFVEQTPSARGGLSLLSFPGLAVSFSLPGDSPIIGMFRKADLFGGDIFTLLENNELYRNSTQVGTLNGSGPVSWAALNTPALVITRGGVPVRYNGTTTNTIVFPDTANVVAVTSLAERVIFVRASSYRFYWSDLLDPMTVNALSYASAESAPDYLKDALAVGDQLYLPGSETTEVWYPSGDADLPFTRITQRTAAKGVPFTGCAVELDNAYHFVGHDRCVYRFGQVPEKISHHGIDETLAAATTIRAFPMVWEGHSVLYVRSDDHTLGFDVGTGEWHERKTDGLDNWMVGCCEQQSDGSPIFGSTTGNDLLIHSGWAEGTSPLAREWTGVIPLTEPTRIDNLTIEANTGAAPLAAGDNPQVEMSYSRDRGNTWSDYRAAALGAEGEFRRRPRWTRLGMFQPPGALFRFRVTDPVPLRCSGAYLDETAAGPSRRG